MAKKGGGLLGSGSKSKSRSHTRLSRGLHVPNVETDPSRSGNPDQVAQRDAEAGKGQMLHKQLKKNKSTGITPRKG